MSGSGLPYNIAENASASFSTNDIVQAKTDGGATGAEADVDDRPYAIWGNWVDDILIQVNEVFQGEQCVDDFNAIDATFDNSVTIGDGTADVQLTLDASSAGAVNLDLDIKRSATGTGNLVFRDGSDLQWVIRDAADDDLEIRRYVGGAHQDSTVVDNSDHKWSFPGDVDVAGDVTITGSVSGVGWSDEYELDFTGEATQDFKSLGGDGDYTIDGNTWTVANSAKAGTFKLLNGTGIQIIHGSATSNLDDSTESGPFIYADLSEFVTTANADDQWRVLFFYEYSNINATYEFAYGGFRSDTSYNGTKNSAVILHGYGGGGADQLALKITASSGSYTMSLGTGAGRPNTDRVMIVVGTSSMLQIGTYSGTTYSGGWPDKSAWQRLFAGQWTAANHTVGDLGYEFQVCFGMYDTSSGDSDGEINLKRILVQRKAG